MLCPVHAADHGGGVRVGDGDGLEDVVRAGEALEPDDAVEGEVAFGEEFVEGFEDEVACVGFLEGVIRLRRVLGHRGYFPNAKGDAEEGEDGLGEVQEGLSGVGGVVVDDGDEDGLGAEAAGELDDDGELVDEEVVGGVDDEADEVEVVGVGEGVVGVVGLAEGAGEDGAGGGDPAVEGEELLDGLDDVLLVHVGGGFVCDAGVYVCMVCVCINR